MVRIHFRIGKAGITQGLVQEIRSQIQETDPITIKLLQNFRQTNDRKQAAQTLADKTDTQIHKLVGGTLELTRKH